MITDKQWMQENVLCLLSNAVKYSSSGEVTLSVSVTNTARGECDVYEYDNTTPTTMAPVPTSDKTDTGSLPLPFYMSRERRLPPTGPIYDSSKQVVYDSKGKNYDSRKSSAKQTTLFYNSNKEHRPPSPTPRSDKSNTSNNNTNSRTVFFTNRQRHIPPTTPVYDNNRPPPFYMSQERRLPLPLSPPLSPPLPPPLPLPKPSGMMRQRPSKQDLTDPACFTRKTIGNGNKVDEPFYNSSKASTPTGSDLVDDGILGGGSGLGALGQGLGALGQQYLMIEVADNGIGIPADKIDTLFAPFKQTQRFAGGMYLYMLCMLYTLY